MGRQLSNWLYRTSTSGVALIALILFLLFSVLILPGQSAKALMDSGGAGSPDTSFLYSTAELYQMAEAYGEQGRQAYIRARFTFDLAFPVVYTLFLVTAVSWLFTRSFPVGSRWRAANLVPLVGAAFDYLENVSTSLIMARLPARTPLVDTLAPLFTLVKWVLVIGSFALVMVGLATSAWRWRQDQRG